MTAAPQAASAAQSNTVRRTIAVAAPPETAFRVFTERMETWWPLESHHIGKAPAAGLLMEPRPGGRWYERGADGSTCDWGRVLAWEPPGRLVLSWEIDADWRPDPALHTEVEVRFVAEGPGRTRVELEHRLLDAYGARRDEMRETFGAAGGWRGLLQAFAAAAR